MAKKILIVDDEPHLVMLIEERLKANGFEVLSALDGQAGYEKAKRDRPDLIILDLMLPKMDGFRVCALLKKDARFHPIPILLFTARAREEDLRLAEEAGCDAYLTKPFDPKALLEKIQELLQRNPNAET